MFPEDAENRLEVMYLQDGYSDLAVTLTERIAVGCGASFAGEGGDVCCCSRYAFGRMLLARVDDSRDTVRVGLRKALDRSTLGFKI